MKGIAFRGVGLLIGLTPLRAQAQACLPASSGTPLHAQDRLREIVTGTDTSAASVRAVYNLPMLPDTAVAIVSDSTTCATAAVKLVEALGGPTQVTPVWVIRIGPDRYWVSDGRRRTGEFHTSALFTGAFDLLCAVTR